MVGGWGISPHVLEPIFGAGSVYVDTNLLLPRIVDNGVLNKNWREIITGEISPSLMPSRLIAGWSTGALLAYGAALPLGAKGLVLIGATPSFCRTPSFRHGTHTSTLVAMKKALAKDSPAVISEFILKCGLTEKYLRKCVQGYNADTLRDGLDVLMQLSLVGQGSPGCPALVFHGKNDTVIPCAAGEYVGSVLGTACIPLNGMHACFIGNEERIKMEIATFTEGINNEPF